MFFNIYYKYDKHCPANEAYLSVHRMTGRTVVVVVAVAVVDHRTLLIGRSEADWPESIDLFGHNCHSSD